MITGERPSIQRLFFALWPSPAEQQRIAALVHHLVEASGGRPVPARNYHLTLVFLGAVDQARVPEVLAVGESVAATHRRPGPPRLALTLAGPQWWRGPRVLVATASFVSPEAAALAAGLSGDLRSGLVNAGFRPDLKPFRPHVTLARKVSRATTGAETLSPALAMPLQFASFALVNSRTEPGGSVYSVVHSWDLCGGAKKTL